MKAFAKTDVGVKRAMNQDYIFASTEFIGALPNLFIVADGMGGHNAGDYASRFCVEEFIKGARVSSERTIISIMKAAICQTSEELICAAVGRPELDGMGTTFVAAVVADDMMYVLNIGDSRLYRLTERLTQITEDHSLVAEMVKNGDLKREDARFHPKKNVVTRAISASGIARPDFFEVPVSRGDVILLCSDGLSTMVGDDEIYAIMNGRRGEIEQMADALIARANECGGKDNISVVLVEI